MSVPVVSYRDRGVRASSADPYARSSDVGLTTEKLTLEAGGKTVERSFSLSTSRKLLVERAGRFQSFREENSSSVQQMNVLAHPQSGSWSCGGRRMQRGSGHQSRSAINMKRPTLAHSVITPNCHSGWTRKPNASNVSPPPMHNMRRWFAIELPNLESPAHEERRTTHESGGDGLGRPLPLLDVVDDGLSPGDQLTLSQHLVHFAAKIALSSGCSSARPSDASASATSFSSCSFFFSRASCVVSAMAFVPDRVATL